MSGKLTNGFKLFLSTPSARRATIFSRYSVHGFFKFLSTPSARRATSCQRGLCPPGGYFYPRPPRGGRRTKALA